MKYVAIDVETANPDYASICQIGVVTFEAGKVTGAWQTLINPQHYFHSNNVSIHGIRERDVATAPTIPQVYEQLSGLLSGQVVAHHSAFDRTAINKVCQKFELPEIACDWLDTVRVARRTWPEFAVRGYGLANVAQTLGISFKHHDAHEDARAAGEILSHALAITGLNLTDLLNRISGPTKNPTCSGKTSMTRQGNPAGPLAGESIVFTGKLSNNRQFLAELSEKAGCDVTLGVTKKTTILVVGNPELTRLSGCKKTSKHSQAEELQANGQSLRIMIESDFLALIVRVPQPA